MLVHTNLCWATGALQSYFEDLTTNLSELVFPIRFTRREGTNWCPDAAISSSCAYSVQKPSRCPSSTYCWHLAGTLRTNGSVNGEDATCPRERGHGTSLIHSDQDYGNFWHRTGKAEECVLRRNFTWHHRQSHKMPPAGFEPATPALGKLCSIHLSYGSKLYYRFLFLHQS